MLEPVMSPRSGRFLWIFIGFFILLGALSEDVVTTEFGVYPVSTICLLFAGVAAIRVLGITTAIRQGRSAMPFVFRAASWLVILLPLLALGALGDPVILSIVGILCALDAAGALLPGREDDAPAEDRPSPFANLRERMTAPLLIGLGLAVVALFHIAYAAHVEGGLLLDWSLMGSMFGIALRYATLPAGRGREEDADPPQEVRRHTRRARPLPDPTRDDVAGHVDLFRRKGDVGPLLAYVESVGGPHVAAQARDLLQRPGTSREDDLTALVALMEKGLTSPTPQREEAPA